MINYPYNFGPPQGWQCPICKRIHSPWVSSCTCKVVVTPTTNTNPFNIPDDFTLPDDYIEWLKENKYKWEKLFTSEKDITTADLKELFPPKDIDLRPGANPE